MKKALARQRRRKRAMARGRRRFVTHTHGRFEMRRETITYHEIPR